MVLDNLFYKCQLTIVNETIALLFFESKRDLKNWLNDLVRPLPKG